MIRLHAMFTDHMVLQREKSVPVWGTGNDGERVAVECRGERVETVVQDGSWRVELPPMDAGGPFELKVSSGEQVIVVRDVLFGDVWLAGGQSNMEWSLVDAAEGPTELPQAAFEKLRYYQVPKIAYDDGLEHEASWVVCTPESAKVFSAVAYFFAKRVMAETSVPIGLIGCNWGGTSASCWVNEEVLERDPALHVYLDEYQEKLRDFSWEAFEQEEAEYKATVDAYNEGAAQGVPASELGDFPWPPPFSSRSFMRPNGLYHAMLRKAAPFALKGFLYYQGESDADKTHLYDRLMSSLIELWRSDWQDSDLPFLFVQLPVFDNDGNPDGEQWPLLREAQWKTARRVAGAWLAAAWEHGEKTDIHPRHKQPIGERLALLALEHVYGYAGIESSGPVWADLRIEGDSVVLRFDHAGADGLRVRGGGELQGFEICGPDRAYVAAEAEIRGDTVIVRNDLVTEPAAVRYGWANYSEANLMGSGGLPAFPFRTDERF